MFTEPWIFAYWDARGKQCGHVHVHVQSFGTISMSCIVCADLCPCSSIQHVQYTCPVLSVDYAPFPQISCCRVNLDELTANEYFRIVTYIFHVTFSFVPMPFPHPHIKKKLFEHCTCICIPPVYSVIIHCKSAQNI